MNHMKMELDEIHLEPISKRLGEKRKKQSFFPIAAEQMSEI